MKHSNDFLPIKDATSSSVAWNLRSCPQCKNLMDFRAFKCRACFLDERRAKHEKFCSGCDKVLPITHFWRRKNGRIISRCKPCVQARVKASPTRLARSAKYKARPDQKAKRIARISVRMKTDIQFRVATRLRNSLRGALHRWHLKKSRKTWDLLGCSIPEFMNYIEAMWLPRMSWSNWGKTKTCWQIDHKRPVSSFDLSDPAQQAECFHYRNFQPLWAPDNWKKADRWDQPKKPIIFLPH